MIVVTISMKAPINGPTPLGAQRVFMACRLKQTVVVSPVRPPATSWRGHHSATSCAQALTDCRSRQLLLAVGTLAAGGSFCQSPHFLPSSKFAALFTPPTGYVRLDVFFSPWNSQEIVEFGFVMPFLKSRPFTRACVHPILVILHRPH